MLGPLLWFLSGSDAMGKLSRATYRFSGVLWLWLRIAHATRARTPPEMTGQPFQFKRFLEKPEKTKSARPFMNSGFSRQAHRNEYLIGF